MISVECGLGRLGGAGLGGRVGSGPCELTRLEERKSEVQSVSGMERCGASQTQPLAARATVCHRQCATVVEASGVLGHSGQRGWFNRTLFCSGVPERHQRKIEFNAKTPGAAEVVCESWRSREMHCPCGL